MDIDSVTERVNMREGRNKKLMDIDFATATVNIHGMRTQFINDHNQDC